MLSDSTSEQILCKANWTGQLSIVDFPVVTPYIPDSPPKEKSLIDTQEKNYVNMVRAPADNMNLLDIMHKH